MLQICVQISVVSGVVRIYNCIHDRCVCGLELDHITYQQWCCHILIARHIHACIPDRDFLPKLGYLEFIGVRFFFYVQYAPDAIY